MSTITYLVDGMTCAHCVASVSAEVANVRAAVEEAGYEFRA